MGARTVTIECAADHAQSLGDAIRGYAQAAYPEGGSDCAQVARETLLVSAAHCQAHRGGSLALRRRQLPQLRAAVRWWQQQRPEATTDLQGLLDRLDVD